MANRNTSGRTKKSNSYRPYDSSNSFVKRFTAKVSEILPQPSSWVSRLFSTSPKLNVRDRDELDDDDEDEEERQPPPKRLCFSSTETNDYSHQNNINQLSNLGRESGEISPIAVSSRIGRGDEERPVAGPSGLHLRHLPISSTPALRPPLARPSPTQLREKAVTRQEGRDDASDESESTSGCSSLVPGTHPRQPTPPPQPVPSNSALTPKSGPRRLSISAAQRTNTSQNCSSLNLSNSQPAFDTYVFNNPLNRSGFRKRMLGDESCFYSGNTTFGGSSSRAVSPGDAPRVVTVRPSPIKQAQSDTIGSSALKILRALEQFSTPVMDVKKMPIRRSGGNLQPGKRKPPAQPYEELIFPSMPDLLKVKRRERELRAQAASATATEGPSTSSGAPQPPSSSSSSQAAPSTSAAKPQPTKGSYAIRTDNPKEKQRSKFVTIEPAPVLNLPHVELPPISALPKLDLKPIQTKSDQLSTSETSRPPRSPPFKFSQPDIPKDISSEVKSVGLPVNKFKFSEPLEPYPEKKTKGQSGVTSIESLPPEHQMKNPSPNFKLKRKTHISTDHVKLPDFAFLIKPSEEIKPEGKSVITSSKSMEMRSIDDSSDNHKRSDNKITPCVKSPLKQTITNQDNLWTCLKCSLKNNNKDEKCKSCGLVKGGKPDSNVFKGFAKPKDTWDCKECFVSNKDSVDVCVACSTPKTGKPTVNKNLFQFSTNESKKDTKVEINNPPLFNSLKSSEGSWECDTCLVKNKKTDIKCVACSSVKPGAKLPEDPKPTFSFGIPTNTSSLPKPSLFSTSEQKPPQMAFSFGIPSENALPKSTSAPAFGNEKKTSEASATSNVVTVSSSTPLVNSIKKVDGSWECGTCLVPNKKETTNCVACSTPKPGCEGLEKPKPTFSFGIPSSLPTAVSSTNSAISSTSVPSTSASSVQPAFTFGTISAEKPSLAPSGFNFTPSIPSSTSNEVKPFTSFNSEPSKEKDGIKPSATSNLFTFGSSTTKDNKPEEMNDEDGEKPAKKKVSFGFPLTSEKTISNDSNSISTFGNVTNKPSESAAPFTFTPFGNAAPAPNAANPPNYQFTFGTASSEPPKMNNSIAPAKPIAFGGASNDTSATPNANPSFGSKLGGFKMPEPENKPFSFIGNPQSGSSGFPFNNTTVNAGSEPTGNSFLFGQNQQQPPSNPFSQPSQGQKPFVFNAAPPSQPAPQPSPFSMNPTQSSQPAAPSGGFNFSAASTMTFNPNVRPSFNFTGGATPSFNAAPSSVVADRKIKRGVRRVTAPR